MAVIDRPLAVPDPTSGSTTHSDLDRALGMCKLASSKLYEAELALHDAEGSGVDAWVKAAADHLHDAVCIYEEARSLVESVRKAS